jgi:hypothetical protein
MKKGGIIPHKRIEEIVISFLSGNSDIMGIYSELHGVGILDTKDYIAIVETFPPRTEPFILKKEPHNEK